MPREFTYSGPHMQAEGRDPDVVTTRWDGDGECTVALSVALSVAQLHDNAMNASLT